MIGGRGDTASRGDGVARDPGTRSYAFAFTGSATEYFRIWIVNLFLSVVTLGLYSPWAKVRKKRYLYGNTWVADANFEYHGNPVAILKGRLLAVAAFLAYSLAGHYLPRFNAAILLLLFLAAPWLIVRSLQFNAVNSSYRNLRFRFDGRHGDVLLAILPFALTPMLAIVLDIGGAGPRQPEQGLAVFLSTLPFFLFYPYVVGALKRLHVSRSSFGSARFAFGARIRSYYGAYALAAAVGVLGFMLSWVMVGALVFIPVVGWMAIPFLFLFFAAGMTALVRARVANLTFNASSLEGGVRMRSTLGARKLARLYFTNLLAILVSAGLLVPWAVIRTVRYRAECLALECDGDLESFLAATTRAVGAAGDELGEFFDVDLSL